MIIPEIPNINHIRETENHKEKIQTKSLVSLSQSDSISIGEESLFVGKLLSQLKKIQCRHDESTLELKQKVMSGEYNPPSELIAKAILYGCFED